MEDTGAEIPIESPPGAVKARMDAGEALALIDVREPFEHALARIEGCELAPMNTVPSRLEEWKRLAAGHLLVVYCHHGVRSLNVAGWLRAQGVMNCTSMAGGIEAWSLEVDRTVGRY
ncbi:MAG: rhodanese [Bryobacterales bacterium]|nr:rhodanese [Bryobacterales bacterium]